MHRLGDAAAGERDLRLVAGGLRVGQPAEQLAGDRGGHRRAVVVDLDPRLGHHFSFGFVASERIVAA